MDLYRHIRAARAFDSTNFVPLTCDGMAIGFVRRELVDPLRVFGEWFSFGTQSIVFGAGLDFDGRSAAMRIVAEALSKQGLLTPWRNETYDIGPSAGGASLFRLERAAVRYFGMLAQAVHVNGLVRDSAGLSMWIARRSPDKAIDPGKLDNMVGGGMASGLSAHETLVKEAWEEAGIPYEVAAKATEAGHLRVRREVPEGLHDERIHVYDLYLPAGFELSNQDGEVAELRRVPVAEALREIEGNAQFTVDAALVVLDCLARHGMLPAGFGEAVRRSGELSGG